MSEQIPTIEELQERIETLMKKSKQISDLKESIIKIQEDLIGALQERTEILEKRVRHSFHAGLWLGMVVATIICIIANLIISTIR
jgi:uncharacterized protein YigA (DUF484 family)